MPHRAGRRPIPLEFAPQLLRRLRPRLLVNPAEEDHVRWWLVGFDVDVVADPSVPPGRFDVGRLHDRAGALACPDCDRPLDQPGCGGRWHG